MATKINEYNKFLISMDKLFSPEKELESVKTPRRNILDRHIQVIYKKYYAENLNSSNYTGLNHRDVESNEINKVNDYQDFKEIFSRKNRKDKKDRKERQKERERERKEKEKEIEKRKVDIFKEVNTIQDILDMIKENPIDESIEYNIDIKALHNIKKPLEELNNMIGMKELKENVVEQILYFIQEFHLSDSTASLDFMHTVIYGPPGTGKTEIAKIIGAIYSRMGILKKGTFKKVTRSDLIAGYLGQTAIKTRDIIQECIGGVLFIDEAYALGNPEKKDSFAKECIDTLCEALSNHKHEIMVIIAGYETELNECFFSYNQGLESRFTWRFKTDHYEAPDLHNIFLKKVKEIGWSITDADTSKDKIQVEWFKKNISSFPYFGRDIETLLAKTKIAHSKRIFGKKEKKQISFGDLEKGFRMYSKNENIKRKEKEQLNQILSSIYV
jgi:SpoVK/Ycf46/Vps4 family AAA+-type ATPase